MRGAPVRAPADLDVERDVERHRRLGGCRHHPPNDVRGLFPGAPHRRRDFRLARGVRGSAQLAGAAPIAEVAERLEDGARAIRDGLLQWTPEVRDRARRTADDLRALVERHGSWSAAEDQRAAAAAERWADVRGGRRRSSARIRARSSWRSNGFTR